MLDTHPDLTSDVIFGLGWLYTILFLMNIGWTLRAYNLKLENKFLSGLAGSHIPSASVWAIYSGVLMMTALAHFTGSSSPESFVVRMPGFLKAGVDWFADPVRYFCLSIGLFVGVVMLRKQLVKPTVAWSLLNLSILFLGLSMTDYDFRLIVGKPDNVPIVGMLFILAFFTWLYFKRAVDNDQRIKDGRPLFEQEKNDKILVWPDLVYSELICMIALTAFLVLWGIALQAPLEEPANAAATPNPSKAPWYFLGLQEMLVYFDPWLAGVVLPSLILVGLAVIPYIDFNKRGNGYYSYEERKFAVLTFLFGFLPLWVAMIVLGTFLRGPNWNVFGIYEYWDVHKLEAANNKNLSDFFWLYWPTGEMLGGMPKYNPQGSAAEMVIAILVREWLGIVLVLGYFMVSPIIMALTVFRKFYVKMGFIRYMIMANLLLWMAALPIKMVLRWTVSLKYIVAIPEYFFNI